MRAYITKALELTGFVGLTLCVAALFFAAAVMAAGWDLTRFAIALRLLTQ